MTTIHNCDLCGSAERQMLPQDPRIAVCQNCGFVYVPERRGPAEVAAAWAEVYASGGYDPQWPGVKARLYYVAEWIDQHLGGMEGKSLLDVGAGDGQFLWTAMFSQGAHPVVGIEPAGGSPDWWIHTDNWHSCPIEDAPAGLGQFDIVTINWTLENTADCMAMLRFAREHVKDDGRVVVATGSRILVPFKKPLSHYLAPQRPADLHCFRWSWNSLIDAGLRMNLHPVVYNDYQDRDEMVVVFIPWGHGGYVSSDYNDKPNDVLRFFDRWEAQWP